MNSDQEKSLFTGYGWDYDFIGRFWLSPDGTQITQDQLMDLTARPEGDVALMRIIVERGVRKV